MNKRYTITEMLPVRKIGTVYGSISGVYSFRKEKSIRFESTLERDLLVKLEFSSTVLDVLEQPVEIPYITDTGRSSTYTPDFLVEYKRSSFSDNERYTPPITLIEVKPRKILIKNWISLKPKFLAAINYARQEGWGFHIYDETRIRDTYLHNIQFLQRYLKMDFDAVDSAQILNSLANMGQNSFSGLIDYLYCAKQNKAVGIAHFWHLIATKKIGCDLSLPFSKQMSIWVNMEESYGCNR